MWIDFWETLGSRIIGFSDRLDLGDEREKFGDKRYDWDRAITITIFSGIKGELFPVF